MKKLKIILQYNYPYLVLLALVLVIAFIRICFIPHTSKIKISSSFTGIITSINYDNERYKLTIKNKEEVICYYNTKEELDIHLGDKIEVTGSFYEPNNNTIPNTFNYKKYLNNHNIFYLFKVKELRVLEKNKSLRYSIKDFIITRANSLNDTKGYIKAFIIGDKTDLESYNIYQKNGVSHLFALSGMHITLLCTIIYFLLKRFKYKDIFMIIFLIFYLSITNYSASLIRSIIFFTYLKINEKYELQIKTKNILILTICTLIINNNYIIYDYGFLYSVCVTYGLIISTKYYKKNYFYNLLITSLVAFLFSLPITASLNYEINLLSIINNLLIVPLVSIIIYPLSLITFIIPFLEPLLNFLIFILESINNFLNLFSLNIIIPKLSIIIHLLFYFLLLLCNKTNNFKYLYLGIIFIIIIQIRPFIDNNTLIYFLDVSQGDSALIVNHNEVILIDTGGVNNYNISDNTIKLIKSLGYNHIDLLLLTHGDADHMKDAINIINNLKVKNVMINNNEINDLERSVINNKAHIVKDYKSKLDLRIYNNYIDKTENDSSIITYLIIDKYQILFMGDAGIKTEKELIKTNIQNIDILKVGHHGSKTSSSKEFINKINPKYAVISVGKNNRYGHPNKETLENLSNSKIYRTDEDGSIMFKIKNNKLDIKTCNP